MDWAGDAEAALEVVKPRLRTQVDSVADAPVDDAAVEVFDALHGEIAESQSLSRDLLEAMNALNSRLEDEWLGGEPRERTTGG